jgi:hypothetical protein
VINTAACNATPTAGCAKAAPTITIGPGPGPPVLDPATRTLYIPAGQCERAPSRCDLAGGAPQLARKCFADLQYVGGLG